MSKEDEIKSIAEKLNLTDLQVEEFGIAFRYFDKDGDGDIDPDELLKCFQFFGQNPTKDELMDLINEVDDDGSGQIEFPEFLALMA